ncbi:MAG: AAA family ATPase [Candidatus Bathyarchaeia archaeon]|jgi:energy-coupling factor transporter ATP-binding protein EcfA2
MGRNLNKDADNTERCELNLRLSKITFKAGQGKEKEPLEVKSSTVVILVGPNNSGKSLALREIENCCKIQQQPYGVPELQKKVVNKIEIDFPANLEDTKKLLSILKTEPPLNYHEELGQNDFWINVHTFDRSPPPGSRQSLIKENEISNAIGNYERMRQILCPPFTVRLDGQTRFSLIEPTEAGDLTSPPQNHLWALFRNESNRKRVSELTQEAFGLYFLVDPTGMKVFKIRMSEKKPEPDEEGVNEKGVKFYKSNPLITDFGDGVKAFTGLVAAILSLPHKIILVDEPEAFLHPPLAKRLGYNLAKISQERDASLIVATHSSEFLVGCMDSGVDVSIVRLTYEQGWASARTLDSNDLKMIMRDPLMRSTNVLRALFTRAAIVTEGDADRAFYEEINRRLQLVGRGIKDAIFLNAQNVQTLHKIVGPLRKIGISASAVADIDFLFDTDGAWENILETCQVERKEWGRIQNERKSITAGITANILKENGIKALSEIEKAKAELLLDELCKYGLFIVPEGELECWLKEIGVKGHTPQWLIELFSKIGSSESDTNYLNPDKNDVWSFIDNIADWINSRNIS